MNLDGVTRLDEVETEAADSASGAANPGTESTTELNNGNLCQDGNDLGPAPLQRAYRLIGFIQKVPPTWRHEQSLEPLPGR